VKLRRSFLPALAGLLLLALAAGAPAQSEAPIPAPPQRWLTDSAGFLSPAAAAEFDSRLEAFERASGHQFIVYIAPSTGVVPIEDWAVRAFEAWKVGRRGLDDGLVLFVMAADKRLRIEVGYGLEGVLPDALAGRVINEEMVPRLAQGDNDGAVRSGIERLIAILSGDAAAAGGGEPQARPSRPLSLVEMVMIGIGVLLFLVLLVTNPSLALYLLFTILSGGRGGGGRGGFSGGGGRSGGGGASGSW